MHQPRVAHRRSHRTGWLAAGGWVANIIDPKTSRLENLATLAERLPAPCLGRVPKLKHAGAAAVAEYLELDLLD